MPAVKNSPDKCTTLQLVCGISCFGRLKRSAVTLDNTQLYACHTETAEVVEVLGHGEFGYWGKFIRVAADPVFTDNPTGKRHFLGEFEILPG